MMWHAIYPLLIPVLAEMSVTLKLVLSFDQGTGSIFFICHKSAVISTAHHFVSASSVIVPASNSLWQKPDYADNTVGGLSVSSRSIQN